MILNEREDLDTWLDFATLCRNGGNTALAERVLQMTQRMSNHYHYSHAASNSANEEMDRRIQFAMLKQQWAVSNKAAALAGLEHLIQNCWQPLSNGSSSNSSTGLSMSSNHPSRGLTVHAGLSYSAGRSSSSTFIHDIPRLSPLVQHSSTADANVHLECLLLLGEWKISIMGPDEFVDPATRRYIILSTCS
jgi:hypothetical protein